MNGIGVKTTFRLKELKGHKKIYPLSISMKMI